MPYNEYEVRYMKETHNEITVMLDHTPEEAIAVLKEHGYIYERSFTVNDIYLAKELNIPMMEVLSDYLMIRDFDGDIRLTHKHKEYDDDGSISSQTKCEVGVKDAKAAMELCLDLGYKPFLNIKDECVIMACDGLKVVVQNVNDGAMVMMEMEENEVFSGIDVLKRKLDETGLDYDDSDFFVNKAARLMAV